MTSHVEDWTENDKPVSPELVVAGKLIMDIKKETIEEKIIYCLNSLPMNTKWFEIIQNS